MQPDELALAQRILKHEFDDPALLQCAFRHASVTEHRLDSNERLEFLGDAILGMVVCEHIFRRYPEYLEGEMTKIKSLTVSRATCARVATGAGLDDLIRVGKGMRTHDTLPASLSAAVTESVIAALYLDGGMEAVRRFLGPLIDPLIDEAVRSGHQNNFKSVLQQHAQRELSVSPVYEVLDEKGPDHQKSFLVRVTIDGEGYGPRWGASKKQAEQNAAQWALRELGMLDHDDDDIDGDGDSDEAELVAQSDED